MTERRYDPVTGEWRMFASRRQDRTFLPPDEFCPLCPTRPGHPPTDVPLPAFDVVVFENRFPSLVAHPPDPEVAGSDLYPVAPSFGANEVVVYSDDHHCGLTQMGAPRIARVVEVWADRYAELGARPDVAYVFIFENRGVAVGVTLHHPHGQIYAYPEIPPRARRELDVALAHIAERGTCVFCDVVARERADGVRVVARNRSFLAFVPFAARFPYEIHVASLRHAASLLDLTDPERLALAELLHDVLTGYDRLFGFPLPYVMSMHQAPTDDGEHQHVSHFHIEFTPLHRTAEKLKYLAGSELGMGAFINDTAPEETAARLRAAVASPGGTP
ncbi:MAG TPA: galactose-1-phosphate uridylyltransferase [Acidimicrobiales bacterium]|nr:galactose-1-phosphate uridylyltransferase [Acidimicrobiales bacterium]